MSLGLLLREGVCSSRTLLIALPPAGGAPGGGGRRSRGCNEDCKSVKSRKKLNDQSNQVIILVTSTDLVQSDGPKTPETFQT
jgi:hypothetical protein